MNSIEIFNNNISIIIPPETMIAVCKVFLSVSLFFVWVVRYDSITKEFDHYKLPEWFRDFVGILKLSFSVMILYNNNELVMVGCVGIIVLMVGAIGTHIRVKNPFIKTMPAVAVGLCAAILYFN
jgi:putative oxidoreductase